MSAATRRAAALLPLIASLLVAPVVPAVSVGSDQLVVPTRAERAHVTPSPEAPSTVVLDDPAAHVAAYWRGRPHARVELAFSEDGQRFGAWQDAGRDEAGQGPEARTFGGLLDAGDATAVRVRTDRPVGRLTLVGISDDGGAATQRQVPALAVAEAATTQPVVTPRAGWGADEALMTWTPQFYDTRKLVVHHTATSGAYADPAAAAEQVRAIYRYHAVDRGWGDIGYNFLIDRFGTVYEGRYSRDYSGANPSGDDAQGRGVTAAHTSGWNSGTVGVAMLGTHTDADVSPAAREALTRLLAWEASSHGIDPEATEAFVNPVSNATTTTPNIAGHRDYAATECPGGIFYGTLPQLRRDVAAQVAGPTPSPPAPDTTAPTTPTGLSAVGRRDRVDVAWAASTDDTGVTSYVLQRKRGSGSFSTVARPTGTSYVDTAVARRTTYSYRVRAKDAAGNLSPWSAVAKTRTG